MKNPLRRDPKTTAERKLPKIESLIAATDEKIRLAETGIEKQKADRRTQLLEDPESEALAAIRDRLAKAETELASLRYERADLTDAKTQLEQELAAAQAAEERDTAAKVLEAAATDVEKAAAELDAAVVSVAQAVRKIVNAIPDDMATYRSDHEARPFEREGGQFASPTEVASALLAEALYRAHPDVFDIQPAMLGIGAATMRTSDRHVALYRMADLTQIPKVRFGNAVPSGMQASEAAKAISAQWRKRAESMRLGELIANPSLIATELPKPRNANLDKVEVYVVQNFAYVENSLGSRQLCGRRWVRSVPALIAEIAVAQGLALRTDTPEGKDAFEREKAYRAKGMTSPASGLSLAECVDLGDPCGFLGEKLAAAE